MNLASEIDKMLSKPEVKRVMEMEPRVIMADKFPMEIMEFLELELIKGINKKRLMRLICLLSVT